MSVSKETIEWQRDVYRELRNTDDHNSGLFSSLHGKSLFSRIMDCVLSGKVPAYPYFENSLDSYSADEKLDIVRFLDDFEIPFSRYNGRITVDDRDLLEERVTAYYIKESVFYDSANSSYKTQVEAICPLINGEDEYEEGKVRFPMFWVRYNDIEPLLSDLYIFPNSLNAKADMLVADYFQRNLYHGAIYKIFNPLGLTLPQQCTTEAELKERQVSIEQQLKAVKTFTYDTFHP